MAEEPDHRLLREQAALLEEPRHRKRVGRKPWKLRVTRTYDPPIEGRWGKPWVTVYGYESKRAREDAVRGYGLKNDVIGKHRVVYTLEKIDG